MEDTDIGSGSLKDLALSEVPVVDPSRGGIVTARGTGEGLVLRLDGRVDGKPREACREKAGRDGIGAVSLVGFGFSPMGNDNAHRRVRDFNGPDRARVWSVPPPPRA